MPVYEFTSPDGQVYEVEGPEGSTQQQAFEKLQSQISATPQQSGYDPETLNIGPMEFDVDAPQWVDEGLAGFGRRGKQIVTLGMGDNNPDMDAALEGSIPAMVGGATADLGSLLAGGMALKGLSLLPKVGGLLGSARTALVAPQTVKQAATGAAAYGAATSPDRVEGALGGAIGGGAGHAIPKIAGGVIKPAIKQGAQHLTKRGATLTPGELLGGGVQRVEDALTSVPLVGDAIKSAKRGSIDDFNKSVIDDALAFVGKKLPKNAKAGRDSIAYADDIISRQYDDILSDMPVVMDAEFGAALGKLNGMVKELPSKTSKRIYKAAVKDTLKNFKGDEGLALGQTFKETDSALRKTFKRLQKSPDYAQNKAGDALREVHRALMDMAKRQHPNQAALLAEADKAYSTMSKVRKASTYAGANDGVFTPAMLVNSIKSPSNKNQFARGRVPMQKMAESVKDVLPSTVPDSGTPLRSMVGLAGAGMIDPTLAATALGGAGLYTKPAQRMLQGLLTHRPAYAGPLRKGLQDIAPYTGLLGMSTALQGQQ